MAEIVDVVRESINGFLAAIGDAETTQLKAQVEAAKALSSGEKNLGEVVDDILKLRQPVDFMAAGRLNINMTMNLTTRKTTAVDGGTTVGVGGFSLNANYNSSFSQDNTSNTNVHIEIVRANQNFGVEEMAQRIQAISELLGSKK